MTTDDIVAHLPYEEEAINGLLGQLHALTDAFRASQGMVKKLDETVPFGDDYHIYVTLREPDAYAKVLDQLVRHTMKIAAPSLSFNSEQIVADLMTQQTACTLRQIIELAIGKLMGTARDEAYKQIVKKVCELLPHRAANPGSIIKGRKLCLRYWERFGKISDESVSALYALGQLILVLAGQPAETVTARFISSRINYDTKPGVTIQIGACGIVSIRFFKNSACEIELDHSDWCYKIAGVLFDSKQANAA